MNAQWSAADQSHTERKFSVEKAASCWNCHKAWTKHCVTTGRRCRTKRALRAQPAVLTKMLTQLDSVAHCAHIHGNSAVTMKAPTATNTLHELVAHGKNA